MKASAELVRLQQSGQTGKDKAISYVLGTKDAPDASGRPLPG